MHRNHHCVAACQSSTVCYADLEGVFPLLPACDLQLHIFSASTHDRLRHFCCSLDEHEAAVSMLQAVDSREPAKVADIVAEALCVTMAHHSQ